MSKPSKAKADRRRVRKAKAAEHEARWHERMTESEARRQARQKEFDEQRRLELAARRSKEQDEWEAGAAAREEARKFRQAEREAGRAAREAAQMEPEVVSAGLRPRRGGGRLWLAAMLTLCGVGGER